MVSRISPKNPHLTRLFLREWREWAGFTQEELAERMETTKGTVSRMELGLREPNLGYLAAVAEALGCQAASLFSHPGLAEAASPAPGSGKEPPEDLLVQLEQATDLLRRIQDGLRRQRR